MKKIITAMAIVAMMTAGAAYAQQPTQPQAQPQQHQHHHHGEGHDGKHHHHGDKDGHHGPHGQRPNMQPAALQYNADGVETTIAKAFPQVKSVKKAEKWTEVYDSNRKLLGYAVYSQPASKGIKGYNGETPVMIALNKKKTIVGVYALPNVETPKFAQRVADAKFYDNWNGLSIKKARKKKVDTVSGATFTSRAVMLSVQAALQQL